MPTIKTVEDDVCDPEDALFPHDDFDPSPGYIYPYLYNENVRLIDEEDTFEYPGDFNPDQATSPPLAGGGLVVILHYGKCYMKLVLKSKMWVKLKVDM